MARRLGAGFGESVGIVAIGFGLLGIAHRETTKRKPFTAPPS
jgi:hypothetical protein